MRKFTRRCADCATPYNELHEIRAAQRRRSSEQTVRQEAARKPTLLGRLRRRARCPSDAALRPRSTGDRDVVRLLLGTSRVMSSRFADADCARDANTSDTRLLDSSRAWLRHRAQIDAGKGDRQGEGCAHPDTGPRPADALLSGRSLPAPCYCRATICADVKRTECRKSRAIDFALFGAPPPSPGRARRGKENACFRFAYRQQTRGC